MILLSFSQLQNSSSLCEANPRAEKKTPSHVFEGMQGIPATASQLSKL